MIRGLDFQRILVRVVMAWQHAASRLALALSSITAVVLQRLNTTLVAHLGRPPEAINATP